MDFVSTHPALLRESKQADRFAELYQQLGRLWEFLALRCDHGAGWRKTKEGNDVCWVCGTLKGKTEDWILLPCKKRKKIGRKLLPNSGVTFPDKSKATVVEDKIEFHGAKLHVDVHNSYRSQLFRDLDMAVAAERIARLEEDGIECSIDGHIASIRLKKRRRGKRPPYGAFVWELPKRRLQKFPLMVEYDSCGNLARVSILRPSRSDESRRRRKSRHSGQALTRRQ